jgi:hypothetical protein
MGRVRFVTEAGNRIQLANNATTPLTLTALNQAPIKLGNHSCTISTSYAITLTSAPIRVSTGSSIYVSVNLGCDWNKLLSLSDNDNHIYTYVGRNCSKFGSVQMWYVDNVKQNSSLTITVVLCEREYHIAIEVVEIQNTANPSLDEFTTKSGNNLIIQEKINTTIANSFGLLSLYTVKGKNSNFITVLPNSIIDTFSIPTSRKRFLYGYIIDGASSHKHFDLVGSHTMDIDIMNDEPIEWAAIIVSIKAAKSVIQLSESANNASLDIMLLK